MRRVNPFRPGAATAPLVLVGRDEHLAALQERIAEAGTYNGEGPVLYGLRGIGKTVLLNTMVERARAQRWAATRVEAGPHTSIVVALAKRTEQLLDTFDRAGRKAWDRVRASVEEITAGAGPARVTVKLAAKKRPATEFDSDVLVPLFDQFGRAAHARGAGVAVMVDELQDASDADLRSLAAAIQHVNSERLPVLVTAGGLPSARLRITTASYAERFSFHPLDYLSLDDTALAFTAPARQVGGTFTPDALSRLVDLAGGYPYFIQLYGRHAWASAGGGNEITIDHVTAGEQVAWRALDRGPYGIRWDKTPASEQQYLAAMAATRRQPATGADVARQLGVAAKAVSYARARLIERGLIDSDGTLMTFALPGFARYVAYRALRDGLDLPLRTREALLQGDIPALPRLLELGGGGTSAPGMGL